MFVSIHFLVFLAGTIFLYFCLRVTWRPAVLLLASWGFCGFIDKSALAVLLAITVISYIAGIEIEKAKKKGNRKKSRTLMAVTVILYICLLCGYKYIPYGMERLGISGGRVGGILVQLVIPVGLSFYLFQAIGYLVDIYKDKSPAERNFVFLGLYFAFFAKFISGPIEREQNFLPQLKELEKVRFLDRGRLSSAFTYLLWGYFMKMVVADRLSVTVGKLFEAPAQFDSLWLFFGMIFYTMQIYCDFAGYSYIAIGCARIFGIKLTHNFEAPYCAGSITEFWRRWHISLSSWLKDYIYIPLGGNRKGFFRKCINTMIVFLVCGMWHGVGLNYVAWGLLHGGYSVADAVLKRNAQRRGRRVCPRYIGHIVTFLAVAAAWVFFRASGLKSAFYYFYEMLTSGIRLGSFTAFREALEIGVVELVIIWLGIAIVWAIDILCSKKKAHLPDLIQKKENAVRYLIFYLLIIGIFIFGMYGPGYHAEEFIYMQF